MTDLMETNLYVICSLSNHCLSSNNSSWPLFNNSGHKSCPRKAPIAYKVYFWAEPKSIQTKPLSFLNSFASVYRVLSNPLLHLFQTEKELKFQMRCLPFKVLTYWLGAKKEGLKQIKAWLDGYFTISQAQDVFLLK